MPYYQDKENNLYYLSSTEHESCLPNTCRQIEDTEAQALSKLLNSKIGRGPSPAIQQILALEAQVTPRRLREAVINEDVSFIEEIEAQIVEIRKTLNPKKE